MGDRLSAKEISTEPDEDLLLNPNGAGAVNLLDRVLKQPVLRGVHESIQDLGVVGGGTGGVATIDITLGNVVKATADDDVAWTFLNPSPAGLSCTLTLVLKNGGLGAQYFPRGVNWVGSTPPTLSADGIDILTFTTIDEGATWNGALTGADFKTAPGYVLFQWGVNGFGQLGDGTRTPRLSPVQIGTEVDWVMSKGSPSHSILLRNGRIFACGSSAAGALGLGAVIQCSSPVQIGSETDWNEAAAGYDHSLGLRSGTLYAWGNGSFGALGNGNTVNVLSPVQIGAETDWYSLYAGYCTSYAERSGKLFTWGWNSDGQLGDGTRIDRHSPVQIGSDADWGYLAAGAQHCLGIRSGKLYAWGLNGYGQLGDGTTAPKSSPIQVGSEMDWDTIAAGTNHSLGIRNGKLYAWGANILGGLGIGNTISVSSPVQVGSETDWFMLIAGGYSSFCLRGSGGEGPSEGRLWAWGQNGYGQLGLGDTVDRSSPVQVGSAADWLFLWSHKGDAQSGIKVRA